MLDEEVHNICINTNGWSPYGIDIMQQQEDRRDC